jgi:hypothetical protein
MDHELAMQATEPRTLDRRRFLTGVVLCLSGSLLPQAPAFSSPAGAAVGPLAATFPDLRAAAAVGRLYLRQHPEEASEAWLTTTLFGSESPLGLGNGSRDEWMEKIRHGRHRDFCDGDVVVLDSWFFARTEARLLALISLHPA